MKPPMIFRGGMYIEHRPSGTVVSFDGRVWARDRFLEFPRITDKNGETDAIFRYARISESGRKICGVGRNDHIYESVDGGPWQDVGAALGPACCAYNGDRLFIEPSAAGIRYFTGPNSYATWDDTRANQDIGIWDYSILADGLWIGQGGSHVGLGEDPAIFWYQGVRRLIEEGQCRFIYAHLVGDLVYAGVWNQAAHRATAYEIPVGEIPGLPVVVNAQPKPPEPPQPPNSPEPPMPDIPDCKSTVERVRATYPTPLGETHARFLLELATAIFKDHGLQAGLLKKSTGTFITLPDSTRVAQDIICFPDGRIFDVLGDGEGAATPQWSEANGSPVDPSRYYVVAQSPPDPPHPPMPDPEPHEHPEYITQIEELHTMLGAALRRLDEHDDEFDGIAQMIEGILTDKFARLTVEGTTASTWGHKHGFAGTVKLKQE